jgi:CheY-like chemotaxis protein
MNDEQHHTILVVDDLRDWRNTIGGLLVDEGYEVCAAGSADEALQVLAEKPFDLAVIDIRLDETDEKNREGLDLAARIKRDWQNTKVVLITGYDTTEIMGRAFARDGGEQPIVKDYVSKTKTEELVVRVRQVLTG